MSKHAGNILCRLAILACVVLTLAFAAAAQTCFVASMDGSQEVPPADTDATGFATLVLSDDMTELDIHVEHDVDTPTASHIHVGTPDVSGPVIHGFADPTSPIDDVWNSDDLQGWLDDLFNGNLYVNVHSPTYPGGEIRGQILLANGDGSCDM